MADREVSDGSAAERNISRAPVIVLIVGAALAVGLVLLGAQLAAAPAALPAAATPGSAAQPRDVTVVMHDYSFQPNPLELFAGETVRLNVINGGMLAHELVLGDGAVQQAWSQADALATPAALLASPPPASVAPDVGGVRVLLGSGQTTTVVYQVPANQPLQLMCHLPGHVEHGMVAEVLIVSR